MGKTHFSGLAVGDVSTGIFGGAMLCLSSRVATPGDIQFNLNEASLIRDITVTNDAGASIVSTVKLGTTVGGVDILAATATVAGTPLAVMKKVPPGPLWVNVSTSASTVWITYATAGT